MPIIPDISDVQIYLILLCHQETVNEPGTYTSRIMQVCSLSLNPANIILFLVLNINIYNQTLLFSGRNQRAVLQHCQCVFPQSNMLRKKVPKVFTFLQELSSMCTFIILFSGFLAFSSPSLLLPPQYPLPLPFHLLLYCKIMFPLQLIKIFVNLID